MLGHRIGRLTQRQRASNSTVPLGQHLQPRAEIDPGRSYFRRPRPVVFDEQLVPNSVLRIAPVDSLDGESMDPADLWRQYILAVLPAADSASSTDLADGVFYQGGRAGDFWAALIH